MKTKIALILVLILLINTLKSQDYLPKDSLNGNIKRIKEKVIFLTDIENPQFLYVDDYGHSGFMGSEETISKFKKMWFSSNLCYYINYEKLFNKDKKNLQEVWMGKNNNFIIKYKKNYDSKNRLIKEIDSTNYSVITKTHFHSYNGIINTILQIDRHSDVFKHTFKRYENNVLKNEKIFYDNGAIQEYQYHYNDSNNLLYRINKNPRIWKKLPDSTLALVLEDSISNVYKDLINIYDSKKRLIVHKEFNFEEKYNEVKNPTLIKQIEYTYQDSLIIQIKKKIKDHYSFYEHFSYSNGNQVLSRHCCNENKENSTIIENYEYTNDLISKLKYTTNKRDYHISFKYKFDHQNNWIEIVKNVDGKDMYKWIREIEYFH